MIATYVWNETSPSSPGTAPSSQPVQGTANWALAGVAAGMLEDCDAVDIIAELVGATGGTLDVTVQSASAANGQFYDVVHFAQLAAGAAAITYRTQLTLTSQPASAAPLVVGKGLSPALAAGTTVQTLGFDRLRLLFVAGASTTAGAAVKVTATAIKSIGMKG